MQQNFLIKYSKLIIAISLLGIIICFIIIANILLAQEFNKKTYLTLQFIPNTAILTIDNQNKELSTGTYEFQPGTYTGTLNAKGFTPKTINFTVEPRKTNSITEYLSSTNEGLGYLEKSLPNIMMLRYVKNDQAIDDFLTNYDLKTSIYDELPLDSTDTLNTNTKVTISDGRKHPKCRSTLCLITTEQSPSLEISKQLITSLGYRIENYNIIQGA